VPSVGRFYVIAPVARALAHAGHDIAFVAPASFQQEVSAAGFETIVAGPTLSELKAHAVGQDPSLPPDRQSALMFLRIAPLALSRELQSLAKAWRPDVIVHEEGEYGGPLVGALTGTPSVAVGWPAPLRPPAVLQRLDTVLAETWKAAGAAPRAFGGIFDTLFLDSCPPTLQAPHAAGIVSRKLVRPVLDTSRCTALPESVDRGMPGVANVHITFGTVLPLEGDVLRIIRHTIEALDGEPVRLVVSVGDGNNPALVGPNSDRLVAVRYLPHHALLPLCDAVICHGGAGSTIAALSHGLPLLILPRGGASQHRHAFACVHAGAALTLPDAEISARTIRSAMRALLHVADYRSAARRIADEIRAMPDPQMAVPEIEQAALTGSRNR
jgi:UDP:flavonoid glycosyltransferase YjiC (YdhE family)